MTSRSIPIRSDKLAMSFSVTATLCDEASAFQRVEILDTEVLGRVLLLDGHVQLATFDERAYHELLVQFPASQVERVRRVLIVGGGDGGALREALRIEGVERVTMVEIDPLVIELSKEHLPSLSAGAFDDPRTELVVGDAFAFAKDATEPYDLIIVDSTDVYEEEEGELSQMLWTEGFYRDLLRLLAPGGIVATQADNIVFCPYSVAEVTSLLARVFPASGGYWGLVPSFGGFSGFAWGRREGGLAEAFAPKAPCAYLNAATYALALTEPTFGG